MADLRLGPHLLAPAVPGLPVLTLAPMAGITNWVFRKLCARFGARLVGAEFVNCRTLDTRSRAIRRALDYSDLEEYQRTGQSLLSAQIYGNDPGLIAAGACRLAELGAPIVDINFGCSVPRILASGSGAAYLRDLHRLYEAVRLTVAAVEVPVTVKARLGWDDTSINILEVVRRAQDAGAQAIAIHARTVRQRYGGAADWSWIGRARQVASVPIIGNGDVRSPADAARLQRQTGCDAVMIGRAAMAAPWIFAGRDRASRQERIDLALGQLADLACFKGERTAVLEIRRFLGLYFAELPRHSPSMQRLLNTGSMAQLTDLLTAWRQEPEADGAA